MAEPRTSPRIRSALVLVAFPALLLVTALAADVTPAAAQDPAGPSHTRAYVFLGAGVGLTIGSFLIAESADHAYDRYLDETDPGAIEQAYDDAVELDRLSAATLIAGQVCLVYGIWQRFLRSPPREPETTFESRTAPRWSVAPAIHHDAPALVVDVRF